MSNHYHLFFRTPHTNLSRGMRELDGGHASYFNARHRRVGHLFQGRFKSHLVDGETYLVELSRYIVLNPVRAGMVKAAGEWPWSSYRATAGLAAVPAWLDPAPILDTFNADDWSKAIVGYREFVAAGSPNASSPWEKLVAGLFLGSGSFLREMEAKRRQRTNSIEHPRVQRLFRAATIDSVRQTVEGMFGAWPPAAGSDARALFILLASRHTHATRAEIGRALGITGRGALHLLRISDARNTIDPSFAALVIEGEGRLEGVRSEVGSE